MGNTSAAPDDHTVHGHPEESKSSPLKSKSHDSSSTLSEGVQAQSSRYSPRLKCAVCSNLHTLHSHCKQCGNICENCSSFHRKGNAFKDHEVINIALPKGTKTNPIEIESSNEQDFLKSPKPNDPPSGIKASKSSKKKGVKHESDPPSKPNMKIVLPIINEMKQIKKEKSIQQDVIIDTSTKTAPNESPSGSKATKCPEKKEVKHESDCTTMQKTDIVLPMKEPLIHQEFLNSNSNKISLDDSPSTSTSSFQLPVKTGMKRKSDSITLKEMGNAVCQKHKSNLLDLCCRDCNVAICSQCLATGHSGHVIDDIAEFFESKRARIKSDLDLIQSHIKQREEAKRELMEEQEQMEQATGNVVKEIKDITEKMQSIIQQKIEDLKSKTREIKKMITNKKGDFNKEINKLETLRKKCQDELSTKDLGAVLFRKDKAPLLEEYQHLPSSYKITQPRFVHGTLDLKTINSFGTIVPVTIQEKCNVLNPLPDHSSNTSMTDQGMKKQRVDNGSPLFVSTARAPTTQDKEILKDAVIPIYLELGKNIM